MKLYQCKIGEVVMDRERLIGHVVGFTYGIDKDQAKKLTNAEKLRWTIPLVEYPDGRRGVHNGNLICYKDGFENFSGENWETLWRYE